MTASLPKRDYQRMASGAARPNSGRTDLSGSSKGRSGKSRSNGRVIEYQTYIDGELRKTRSRVKWVDIGTSLTLLLIGILGYLLFAALVDHWLFARGLGFFGRIVLCVGLVGGITYHLIGRFAPLLIRKVNPVYAAEAIERGQPMKNSLINFLLLRKHPQGQSEQVLDAMKEQAAVRLSAVPADAPVDRSGLIRLGYVLCAVLIALVVYALAGPKDTFRSVSRVVAPWADIAAPTRVRILELAPADAERRRDEFVEVKVHTRGMRTSDQASVFYSITGKPEDDVAVPLASDDNSTWTASLPDTADGLKQDIYYYVRVGDAESPRYRIRVAMTPVISVANVRYEYPAYTELPPRDAGRQADLRGLEGSRVVITAETNQKIKSAYASFDGSRQRDVEFTPDESGNQAVGSFELALTKDRSTSTRHNYLLRFANIDGQENPKPIEHKIEVTADQPPEVKVLEPKTPETQALQVPLGSQLRITLSARDPDFKLADLAVVLEKFGGAPLAEVKLLTERHRSEHSNTLVFEASRYGLKVGDRVTFRGRAVDNKAPQPNVAETPRYTIVVTQGDAIPQQQPPQPNQQDQSRPNGNSQQNPPQQNPQQNQSQPNNQGSQGNSQQPNQPQEGQPQNNPQQQPDAKNQSSNSQPSESNQNNSPQQGSPQNRNQQGGDQQTNQRKNDDPQNQSQRSDGRPDQGRTQDQNPNQSPQDKNQQANSSGGKPQEGDRGGEKNGGDQSSGSKSGDKGDSQNERKADNDKPIDPETNAPEAVDALKRFFDKKDGKQPEPPKNADNGANDDKRQARNDQPRNQQGNGNEQGKNEPGKNEPGKNEPGKNEPGRDGDQQGNKQPEMNQGSQPGNDPNKKPGPEKGTEKGTEQGTSQGSPNNNGGEPSDPNGKGRNENDKPGPQEKPQDKKNEADGQSGAQSGAGQQKGNEPGKQGSDSSSNGGASGQKTDRPSGQAGSPGGTEGSRSDQPSGGNNPSREGKNDGGREIERKPTDGTGGGEKKDVTGQKPPDMSQAKPADQNGGQAGAKPTTDAPTSGTGRAPKENGNQDAPKTGTANEGNPTPQRNGEQSNSGDGGRSGSSSSKPDEKPDAKPKTGDQPNGEAPKPSDNAGDQAGNQKNPGQQGGDTSKEGSPASQEMTRPRNGNSPGAAESARPDEAKPEEGKSPGHGKSESNTEGDAAGDQKGKGDKGGGVRSKKEGTGSSGTNTPGDQGGAAANEDGDSVAGNKPGDKARGKAPDSTDPSQSQSSGEKGEGSRTRPGGEQPGGESRMPEGTASRSNDSQPGGDSKQDGDSRQGSDSQASNGAKQPGNDSSGRTQSGGGGKLADHSGDEGPHPDRPLESGPPNGSGGRGAAPPKGSQTKHEAEAANLEFTKQTTDLTLQRLQNELSKGEIDPELLKTFGSREALERFANRHQEMLARAKQAGAEGDAARKDLDEFYKGLGLRAGDVARQGSRTGDDDSRNLQGARRSEPPAKYLDRYRAYTQFQDQTPAQPANRP